ncbi:MAG TPA: helicase-related protein [Gemmatimonadaceae bacterium]|nr:helicase-related protein [Gemmatimonadaceae bacterium]
MDRIELASPEDVRAVIAHEWLRCGSVPERLGAITLRPHQIDAARRLTIMIAANGGALLCDEVGLGKTYVALCLARAYAQPVVVAPAALRSMWLAAATRCAGDVAFVSMESLSRSKSPAAYGDLLIVDEAHHFRTPSTARYRTLAALCARCPVLLVSATPLHNRESDMVALLSLFLGSAARILAPAEAARFVVRRDQHGLPGAFPLVRPPRRIAIRVDGGDLQRILALPPPTPPSDGGTADAMIAHALVRLWASSDAALREGLRRRWARTVAMRHSLEAGRHPTKRELHDWAYSDCAVQLGFVELLSSPSHTDCSDLMATVAAHERALVALIDELKRSSGGDARRVAAVRAIRDRHPSVAIVAFSQFAETVRMYYRALAPAGGVVMLTSRGGRIASGPITRGEALDRFAPIAQHARPPHASQALSLLLTTDLLSEGVNLQDAAVVVHLDLPWTAAALEQRVGRVARMGSPHREVFVYAIDPPASSRRLLRAEAVIRRKAELAERSVGASRIPPLFARADEAPRSEVEESEAIRRELTGWLRHDRPSAAGATVLGAAGADRDGVLALISVRGTLTLLAGEGSVLSVDARVVRSVVDRALGEPVQLAADSRANVVESVERWIEAALAADDAGNSAAGRSRLARSITTRLARELVACPRHAHACCSTRIAALHSRLELPFTLGVEWEIEELLRSDSSDLVSDLERIIGARETRRDDSESGVRAVLVLRGHSAPTETLAETKM